ncbi:ABC transporter G family member 20 [Orchesella cincta]|uniref:ABC transporter G family member 20 n=1 Tax=Orchesella cincta TaxID=48709 RepID=A0A1D2MUK1_ORCCI|nr:ABC transporter G family member 20 [Orchesella cincta]
MEDTEQKYENPGFEAGPEEIGMANLNGNAAAVLATTTTTVAPSNGAAAAATSISMPKEATTRIVNNTRSAEWNANNAVVIRNAMKTYRGAKSPVLNDFNMTVKEGTIYSLLGSSGCGKTTTLSCVVGLRKLDDGSITVFGARPGTKQSGIPGRRVGYMPQDICLYEDFTICETLQYFGTICGMTKDEIEDQVDFLIDFLDLPPAYRTVRTLSGGQKRRVSFAAALIHSPELLILDEPIGLMRSGRLLAEKSPDALLQEYNTNLLEDIVLKLCKNDTMGITEEEAAKQNEEDDPVAQAIEEISFQSQARLSITAMSPNNASAPRFRNSTSKDGPGSPVLAPKVSTNPQPPQNPHKLEKSLSSRSVISYKRKQSFKQDIHDEIYLGFSRLKALVRKNLILLMRNRKFLFFVLILPCIQMMNVCVTVGNDPTDLEVGVVNFDSDCKNYSMDDCIPRHLSCRFLDLLPGQNSQNRTLKLIPFDTEEEALEQTKAGKTWGFMVFPENYSTYMYERAISGAEPTEEVLNGSIISFEMDMTSKQVAETIRTTFFFTFQKYIIQLFESCGFDRRVGEIPLKLEEPIYGSTDTNFRQFLAPSAILGIIFFCPLITGGVNHISDKKRGTLDRGLVSGVRTVEILVSYFITEGIVLVVQTLLIFLIITQLFTIEFNGPIYWGIILSLLIGFCGLSLGFLASTFCTEEVQTILVSIGSYYPNMVLSGMVWPLEGIPKFLQYIAYLVPCNMACESMRSLATRGWGIDHPHVWPGFVSTIGWILLYWILTILVHKTVKN